jgi:hypothetical protein
VPSVNRASAMTRHRVIALVLSLALAGCAVGSSAGSPEVRLATAADGAAWFEVVNLSAAMVTAATSRELTREEWTDVLRVSVNDTQPAMVGTYSIEGHTLRFTPMFPLDPGREYRVSFKAAALPGLESERSSVDGTFALPAVTRDPATTVERMYPSGDRVPANQLRLYLHFSAPMGRKGGLEYVQLVDDKGAAVVDPFLPLDAEFFNAERTRYTVFFDPGRQKRGILPNQQMGRSLEPGQRYTLVVSREWADGNGMPLREEFRKAFVVTPPDEQPLDVSAWRVTAPAAGTRAALSVAFPEPLDHGLLLRALGVAGGDGTFLEGEVAVDPGETGWRFTPRDPWQAATYQLVALGMLEDLAGNRIGRAFEVDNFDRVDRTAEAERTVIPFTVRH